MAHKTMVGGTNYDITGGRTMVDGTVYGIQKGKTMVDGTVGEIGFSTGIPISEAGLAVGDSVFAKVNGVRTEFLIVQTKKPSSMYDSSCDGYWLLAKDVYERRAWNSSNRNSYKDSTIHTYLNGAFLDLFDTGIKSQIKTVKIPYVNGTGQSGSVASGSNGLETKIFLLSAYEVGITTVEVFTVPADGYDKLSYFTNNTRRVAYFNGKANVWALRTPTSGANLYCIGVTTGGTGTYQSCSGTNGIRPAFIIDGSVCVDENYNLIG